MVAQMPSREDTKVDVPIDRSARGRGRFTVIVIGVLALVLGLGAGWAASRSRDSGPSDATLETVVAWEAAVEGQDVGAIGDLYSEDATWYDEALDDRFSGRSGVKVAWNIFSGIDTVTVDRLAVEGDIAVMRWTFVGDRALDLTGISVLELDGDVVVAETVYYDCAQSPVAASCANR